MIYLRKKIEKLAEDVDADTQDSEDISFKQKKMQLLQQKNNAKMQYDRTAQRVDTQILQLYNQSIQKSKQNSNNQNTQNNKTNNDNKESEKSEKNESLKYRNYKKLFEGKNHKHDLLANAFANTIKKIELSYVLSDIEIYRISRKINDILNKNKDNTDILNVLRYEIKKYLLNHNTISLSQSEINKLLDEFEKELKKPKYSEFNYIFNSTFDEITINIDFDTNIDELEADLENEGFDIDEDLDNDILILTNVNKSNIKTLKDILIDYNLLKINRNIF